MKTIARQHRTAHPADGRYTPLDWLYLLSLTSGRLSLKTARLGRDLAASGTLRAQVLPFLLRTRRIPRDELQAMPNVFVALKDEFPSLAHLEGEPTDATLHIGSEVRPALYEVADELGLPDTGLGNAFWAMYWHDKLPPIDSTETFWMRHIAQHIKNAAARISDRSLQVKVTHQLATVGLVAARGCLRTGLFGDAIAALKRSGELLAGQAWGHGESQRHLLTLTWEAYSVLGDDELLLLFVEQTPPELVPGPAHHNHSLELFVESLKLPASVRETASLALLRGAQAAPDRNAIVDYAHVRSGWLALAGAPATRALPRSTFKSTVAALDVLAAAEAAAGRLAKERSGVPVVDFMTVSIGLWCLVLQCSLLQRRRTPSPDSLSTDDAVAVVARRHLSRVVGLAETAAILAQQIQRKTAGRQLGLDFVRDGLARETSIMALAAAVAAWSVVDRDHGEEVSREFVPRVRRSRTCLWRRWVRDAAHFVPGRPALAPASSSHRYAISDMRVALEKAGGHRA